MIKHNKSLIHIDLSSTGLGKFIIKEIGTCLKRAKSCLAVHLSGNFGLNPENYEFLINRIKSRPNEDIARFLRIEKVIYEMTKNYPP